MLQIRPSKFGGALSVVDTVEPEADLVAKYEKKYQVYKSLYPQCKPLYDNIVAAQ